MIKIFKNIFNITVNWNYFSAGHGKGPVDGVGASVKRSISTLVKSRRTVVNNALDFARAFQMKTSSSIKLMSVFEHEINHSLITLNADKLFADEPPAEGITSAHHVSVENGVTTLSPVHPIHSYTGVVAAQSQCVEQIPTNETTLEPAPSSENVSANSKPAGCRVGAFVVVCYEGIGEGFSIGVIDRILDAGKVRIKYMTSIGPNRFCWPPTDEFDEILFETILCNIKEPEFLYTGSRVILFMQASEYRKVVNLYLKIK